MNKLAIAGALVVAAGVGYEFGVSNTKKNVIKALEKKLPLAIGVLLRVYEEHRDDPDFASAKQAFDEALEFVKIVNP